MIILSKSNYLINTNIDKINQIVKLLKDMNVDGISEVFRRNNFDSNIQISSESQLNYSKSKDYSETMFKPSLTTDERPEFLLDLKETDTINKDCYKYLPWEHNLKKILEAENIITQAITDDKSSKNNSFERHEETKQPKPEESDIHFATTYNPIGLLRYKPSIKVRKDSKYSKTWNVNIKKFEYRHKGKSSTNVSQK